MASSCQIMRVNAAGTRRCSRAKGVAAAAALERNMFDSEKMLDLANTYDKARRMIEMLNSQENLLHITLSDGRQEAVLDISLQDGGPGADFMGNLATALEQFGNTMAHRIQDEVRRAHID